MPFKKTAAHAPTLLSAPRIVSAVLGTYQVGILLTCIPGTYTNNPTARTYQWKLNGVSIGGATAITYLPTTVGVITCAETVANNQGALTTPTAPVTVIAAPLAPVVTVNPAITGSMVEGGTATLSTGTWLNSPAGYAAQWYRGASPIAGATGFTRIWQGADVGQNITGRVTASNGGGSNTAISNTVVPTAAPSGIPIPNAAALLAMFAAGVGASGGKTYILAGVDFGAVSLSNYDFSSNPIIIGGQSGTVLTSLVLANVKGVTWNDFNVYGSATGTAVTISDGSAHITFNRVKTNAPTRSGNGWAIDSSSYITVNGPSNAAAPDINNRVTAMVLTDSSNLTLSGLTTTNVGPDGILLAGVSNVTIDACLGFNWIWTAGDHPDFIQGFTSYRSGNGNTGVTIINCGWLRESGLQAQGYFFEATSNLVVDTCYFFGGFGNFIQQSGGTTAQLNNNFGQGFGDYGAVAIARDVAVNVTMTNNKAEGFNNYAGGGANPGFVPAILPGTNTVIGSTTAGHYATLDAWLTANPLARRRP